MAELFAVMIDGSINRVKLSTAAAADVEKLFLDAAAELAKRDAIIERKAEEIRLACVEIINMTTLDQRKEIFERILKGVAESHCKKQEQNT